MLLTLHNIEHQGHCGVNQIARIGLNPEKYTAPESPKELINLLERGIIDSSLITTVSPTYLKEIMTPKGGHGLDLILKKHQSKIQGILNGIDYNYWNPKTDPYLAHHFNTPFESVDHQINGVIKAKSGNKKELQKRLGLRQRQVPLICCVTRLVHQKGPSLIAKAIRRTLHHKGQFILLGSEGSTEMNKLFISLQNEFAHTKDFSLILERNEPLAHLTFAGSDMTIIPSLFEPCGLTQMIALRYASIPIVRKTGGLADTVFDISESKERRNGFTFTEALDEMIDKVIDRAIETYQKEKEIWSELMENAVSSDHSWRHSMQEYVS
jgi:starch synthase